MQNNVIRPNFSSPVIAARARALQFHVAKDTVKVLDVSKLDVSWLSPHADNTTQKTETVPADHAGCEYCLLYTSRCYCAA